MTGSLTSCAGCEAASRNRLVVCAKHDGRLQHEDTILAEGDYAYIDDNNARLFDLSSPLHEAPRPLLHCRLCSRTFRTEHGRSTHQKEYHR
jgi:hypothetical protein